MPQAPSCVGTYEADHITCNGEPEGATEEDRAPCAWRNRCTALSVYCQESGSRPDTVVAALSFEALGTLTDNYIEKHAISQGHVGGPPEPPPPPPPPPKPKATPKPHKPRKPKTYKRSTKKRDRAGVVDREWFSENAQAAIRHFEQLLLDHFPEREFSLSDKLIIRPGVVYSYVRPDFVAWYVTTKKGIDFPLARMYCKVYAPPDVLITPMDADIKGFVAKAVYKKLNTKQLLTPNRGRFNTTCRSLDDEGLGVLVEFLRNFVDAGRLVLPEAS